MSKIILSYIFKTNLAEFRAAILADNTDRICRLLDIEREFLNKSIDSNGNTALILAILHASPLTIRLLLEQGAQPDQPNSLIYQTPLATVASKVYDDFNSYKAQRTLEMGKILLEYGAYVDKPSLRTYLDENNRDYTAKETPLMIAVRKRNLPLVKLLIEKKANVNRMERQSQTRAIHFAISNGDEAMFDVLLDEGALCSSIITSGENTLLHWFCYKKENDQQIELLKKILDQGCDINAQNWKERTPLMTAAKLDMIETCRVLLKNRAAIDKRDFNGNDAIDLAVPGSECSTLLIEYKKNQTSPASDSQEKLLWKKRIEPKRRSTIETSEINRAALPPRADGTQIKHVPHSPSMGPVERRESQSSPLKSRSGSGRAFRTTPKRRLFHKLHKAQSQSINTGLHVQQNSHSSFGK